jgi:hypothetical protein
MNKAAIRSQFKALLNRNDCTNVLADTFIDQAISRIQRTLRIPPMERTAEITFTPALPDSFLLPTDFLEFIDLYREDATGGAKLRQVPRGTFLGMPKVGGEPAVYLRTGGSVQIKPVPALDASLSLIYYGELSAMDADTDTNEIAAIAPELIIYAALSFASDYFVDERKDAFESVYTRTYQELEEQARAMEFSGADNAVQSPYSGMY